MQWSLSDLQQHWAGRGGHVISIKWLLAAAAVFALLLGGLWLHRWWQKRCIEPGPMLTFRRVARSVGLSLHDRRLLVRISAHQKLISPLTLMLSDTTLQFHGKQFAACLESPRREQAMQRVRLICQLLFES